MITIIDYKAGNLASISNAVEKLGAEVQITNKPEDIQKAEKIIFPGVGEAKSAMQNLQDLNLVEPIRAFKGPFLGICLGMQLLFTKSEERDADCLNIIEGTVTKFPENVGLKVPQIGWNTVHHNDSPLFKDINQNEYFYFVHSYYAPLTEFTSGETEYGEKYSSAVQKENFYGTQFHPEKSGEIGLKLLNNFLKL